MQGFVWCSPAYIGMAAAAMPQVTPGGRNCVTPSLQPWSSFVSQNWFLLPVPSASVPEGSKKKNALPCRTVVQICLGKVRLWYWQKLLRSTARTHALVLIAALSMTSKWLVLLSEPLSFHNLKYKPIGTVLLSCMSLPNEQNDLSRLIWSHL